MSKPLPMALVYKKTFRILPTFSQVGERKCTTHDNLITILFASAFANKSAI